MRQCFIWLTILINPLMDLSAADMTSEHILFKLDAMVPSLVAFRVTQVRNRLSQVHCCLITTSVYWLAVHIRWDGPVFMHELCWSSSLSGLWSSLCKFLCDGYCVRALTSVLLAGVRILPDFRSGGWYADVSLLHALPIDGLFFKVYYVWKSRWTLGKILFFFNRYGPIIDLVMSVYGEWLTTYIILYGMLTFKTFNTALVGVKDPNVMWYRLLYIPCCLIWCPRHVSR